MHSHFPGRLHQAVVEDLRYRPALGAFVDVSYRSAKANVDESRGVRLVLPFHDGPVAVDWDRAEVVDLELDHLEDVPLDSVSYGSLPAKAAEGRQYKAWGRAIQAVEKRKGMTRQRTLNTAVRVGESLLGAFLGRKTSTYRAGTSIRSAGGVLRGRQDIAQAEETVDAVREQLEAMEAEFQAELRQVEAGLAEESPLDEVQIRPTLTGMTTRLSTLLWLPEDGSGRALWR